MRPALKPALRAPIAAIAMAAASTLVLFSACTGGGETTSGNSPSSNSAAPTQTVKGTGGASLPTDDLPALYSVPPVLGNWTPQTVDPRALATGTAPITQNVTPMVPTAQVGPKVPFQTDVTPLPQNPPTATNAPQPTAGQPNTARPSQTRTAQQPPQTQNQPPQTQNQPPRTQNQPPQTQNQPPRTQNPPTRRAPSRTVVAPSGRGTNLSSVPVPTKSRTVKPGRLLPRTSQYFSVAVTNIGMTAPDSRGVRLLTAYGTICVNKLPSTARGGKVEVGLDPWSLHGDTGDVSPWYGLAGTPGKADFPTSRLLAVDECLQGRLPFAVVGKPIQLRYENPWGEHHQWQIAR